MGNGTIKLNLTGQQFGRLTAVEPLYQDTHKNWIWSCACSCGNLKQAKSTNLRRGIVKSCGCLAKENGPKMAKLHRQLPAGVGARNMLLAQYRLGATDRDYVFDLSVEDFSKLTSSVCYYCGAPPSTVQKQKSGNYIYNGIDRLDNSLGYTLENCVPCCKICNGMKSNLALNTFLEYIRRIHDNLNL